MTEPIEQPIEQLRAVVAAGPPPPPALDRYLDTVRSGAYALTDADVAELVAAGFSEEEIFRHTVEVSVAEGLRRLDAGLGAIG